MTTHQTFTDDNEQIRHGLKVFGDAWNLAIVSSLASEVGQRFNELQRSLGDISPTTLTDRLKRLEQHGLIVQEKRTVDKLSVIYSLTEKGKNMLPILGEIEAFTKKYL